MKKKPAYKSELFEAIHESALALRSVGAIDTATMRDFDVACLAEVPPFGPAEIKRLRRRVRVSQPVFARYLNTSQSTIEKWETGAKRPSAIALKLLAVVQKHGLDVLT
jgi:putative transcriptional regulator